MRLSSVAMPKSLTLVAMATKWTSIMPSENIRNTILNVSHLPIVSSLNGWSCVINLSLAAAAMFFTSSAHAVTQSSDIPAKLLTNLVDKLGLAVQYQLATLNNAVKNSPMPTHQDQDNQCDLSSLFADCENSHMR